MLEKILTALMIVFAILVNGYIFWEFIKAITS